MRLSVAFTGFGELRPTMEVVRAAEDAGFDGVISAEHLGFHDGIVPTAMYAMNTDRIELGIVGLSATGRHPGLLGMELASLNEISDGRLRVQVGTGDGALAALLGKEIGKPLAYTRSLVDSLRGAMSGRKMSLRTDEFAFDGFKLSGVAAVPPVDVMAIRPRMVRLACEIADGVSLSMGGSLQYLRDVVADVERHLAELGRDRSEFRVTALTVASIHDDIDVARGPIPALMAMGPVSSIAYLARGVVEPETLIEASRTGGMFAMMQHIGPEVIDATSLAATPHTLEEKLAAYADTGIDELGVLLLGDADAHPKLIRQIADARP